MKGVLKLSNFPPRHSLITIYMSFVWRYGLVLRNSHYGDTVKYLPNNDKIYFKTDSLQYNAAFKIAGAIRFYRELDVSNNVLVLPHWYITVLLLYIFLLQAQQSITKSH